MTGSRGLQAFRRCWRSHRSAGLARPRTDPLPPRVESSLSLDRRSSRVEAFRRGLFASAETVLPFRAVALSEWSPAAAALSAGARQCQGVKYLPGNVLPPNQWLERTAQQLRCWVPASLRAAAAAQPPR